MKLYLCISQLRKLFTTNLVSLPINVFNSLYLRDFVDSGA